MTHPAHENARIRLAHELADELARRRPHTRSDLLAHAVEHDDRTWNALCKVVRPRRKPSAATRAMLVALLKQSAHYTAAEQQAWQAEAERAAEEAMYDAMEFEDERIAAMHSGEPDWDLHGRKSDW